MTNDTSDSSGSHQKRYQLLINDEFWDDMYRELDRARERVYMQFMTFEGDETGLRLGRKLKEVKGKGPDVKMLVDRYTDFFVSNKYYLDPTVEDEVKETRKMMQDLIDHGVELKRTRPFGSPQVFFLARNHKKIIVIDDVCYLGGINVSDHNHEWHDFMVKIIHPELVQIVIEDFLANFRGIEQDFLKWNIMTNTYLEKTYYSLIEHAKEEIIISSPYIIDLHLAKIFRKKKHIRRSLLTLAQYNYKLYNIMSDYLYHLLARDGTEISRYTDFSHAKFMIIDRKILLLGSSNFGTESFVSKEEIGIVIFDEDFVKEFIERMYTDNQKYLQPYEPPEGRYLPQRLLTRIIFSLMRFYGKTFVKLVKPLG